MLPATRSSLKSSPVPFEPLLDLHEAASMLGMHWKTLEGKARANMKCPPSKLESAGDSGLVP
jgi:hypothetical protein